MTRPSENIDRSTVRDFGREWRRFDQGAVSDAEMTRTFDEYFAIFPWSALPKDAVGFDAGCGSGRWAALVAPRVGHLHCADASVDALAVARKNLAAATNVSIHECPLDAMPMPDESMDFGYSLGVLHHIPDLQAGLAACVRKLRSGAPMLVYIYYALDNRPFWFRALWRVSDTIRRVVSKAPFRVKSFLADAVAATVYWPLAFVARRGEKFGLNVSNWPLSAYRWHSFYTIRTDALDRFGTRLEHRMTQDQIRSAMERPGCAISSFRKLCRSGARSVARPE